MKQQDLIIVFCISTAIAINHFWGTDTIWGNAIAGGIGGVIGGILDISYSRFKRRKDPGYQSKPLNIPLWLAIALGIELAAYLLGYPSRPAAEGLPYLYLFGEDRWNPEMNEAFNEYLRLRDQKYAILLITTVVIGYSLHLAQHRKQDNRQG